MSRLTRAEQRDVTRTRLLDAAEKVFVDRGFHAASVDDVAEEAGYSKGAVYSNFENKDELFLAVLERRVDSRALAAGSAVPDDQPITEQAEQAGNAFFEVFLQQSQWSLLLMSSDDLATVLFALGDGFIMTKLIEPDEIHDDLFGQALVLMLAGLQSTEPAPA